MSTEPPIPMRNPVDISDIKGEALTFKSRLDDIKASLSRS